MGVGEQCGWMGNVKADVTEDLSICSFISILKYTTS